MPSETTLVLTSIFWPGGAPLTPSRSWKSTPTFVLMRSTFCSARHIFTVGVQVGGSGALPPEQPPPLQPDQLNEGNEHFGSSPGCPPVQVITGGPQGKSKDVHFRWVNACLNENAAGAYPVMFELVSPRDKLQVSGARRRSIAGKGCLILASERTVCNTPFMARRP